MPAVGLPPGPGTKRRLKEALERAPDGLTVPEAAAILGLPPARRPGLRGALLDGIGEGWSERAGYRRAGGNQAAVVYRATGGGVSEMRGEGMTTKELAEVIAALPGMPPVERARAAKELIDTAKAVLSAERRAALAEATAPGAEFYRRIPDLARELGVSRGKVDEALAAHRAAASG